MGVFEFVKEGAVELHVGRPPASAGEPVARHSAYIVPLAAELTVDAGDVAVFVGADHEPVGVLGPGRHSLHESTAPFLVEGKRHEGWAVRIWFVRIRPFQVGEAWLQIVDPEACVRTLARRGPPAEFSAFVTQLAAVPDALAAAGLREAAPLAASLTPPAPVVGAGGHELPCPSCKTPGEVGSFCATCGLRIAAERLCLACGHALEGARFCASCGARAAP